MAHISFKLRIWPDCCDCRQLPTQHGGALPGDWRPTPEDEAFARRHGMNPKGVAHALRRDAQAPSAIEGTMIDGSALWRAWIQRHAVEPPCFSVILTGT